MFAARFQRRRAGAPRAKEIPELFAEDSPQILGSTSVEVEIAQLEEEVFRHLARSSRGCGMVSTASLAGDGRAAVLRNLLLCRRPPRVVVGAVFTHEGNGVSWVVLLPVVYRLVHWHLSASVMGEVGLSAAGRPVHSHHAHLTRCAQKVVLYERVELLICMEHTSFIDS